MLEVCYNLEIRGRSARDVQLHLQRHVTIQPQRLMGFHWGDRQLPCSPCHVMCRSAGNDRYRLGARKHGAGNVKMLACEWAVDLAKTQRGPEGLAPYRRPSDMN